MTIKCQHHARRTFAWRREVDHANPCTITDNRLEPVRRPIPTPTKEKHAKKYN